MPTNTVVMTTTPAPLAPPSAPLLTMDEPDDIPEPMLPPGLADEAMHADTPGLPAEALSMPQDASNGTTPPLVPSTVPPLPDAFLALAHGFCQYLQGKLHGIIAEEHHHWMSGFDTAMASIRTHMQEVLQGNEHASYSLADAIHTVMDRGLTVSGAPYEMQLQVLTPAGVPLTLTIRKTSPADLLDELTRLEGWLSSNGYTGAAGAVAA